MTRLAYVCFVACDEACEEMAAIFDAGFLWAMPLLLRTVIHLWICTNRSSKLIGLPVVRIFSSSFFQKLFYM